MIWTDNSSSEDFKIDIFNMQGFLLYSSMLSSNTTHLIPNINEPFVIVKAGTKHFNKIVKIKL